ncbi:alpha/beta hydrolase [Umezawaea sp. Da 62-37]|uniref:alpha/beta fold hydrolase n=1 Tax=Umezawaea sp. Da 62-37 TaxID=3075927 RepID=UPI0028F6D86F|nr:alpha/beta hydrolase [Umezawaea sp. Da 62-37]WNV91675.1 alpha/beta hydrolase [Umezawaea sp. Da 62-37]
MITSADGTDVRVHDEGSGPVVVLLGPGLDDGTRDRKLAALLARRFRVIRPHRRQYRTDLKADLVNGSPCAVADEVEDVLAIVRSVGGGPVVLYGHSDGGVVALEALAASPSSFAGAVVFEPAAATDEPVGGEVLARAREALAAGRPGRAMAIFFEGGVGLPAWQARAAGAAVALMPKYRGLVPGQLDSLEALDRLGVRTDVYARIEVPTVLLGGDRSPARLAAWVDAIARVMPAAERIVLPGADHGADLKHPDVVARIVEDLADRVLG